MKGMKTLLRLIDEAEDECSRAVDHVGSANYDDRIAEANHWVEKAFEKIRKQAEKIQVEKN